MPSAPRSSSSATAWIMEPKMSGLISRQLPRGKQIGASHTGETWHIGSAGKQSAVDVGKDIGQARQLCRSAIPNRGVHGAEHSPNHLMGVGGVARAHLLDGFCEQASAVEDIGILGEEAEDQP